MALIKFSVKRSPNDRAILECRFKSVQVEFAEFCVGMLEDQNITGRERGAVIHLLATTWGREMCEPRSVSIRNFLGGSIARYGDDDNFRRWRELGEGGNEHRQIFCVVPRGNYETDGKALSLTSTLPDHETPVATCGCLINSGSFNRSS